MNKYFLFSSSYLNDRKNIEAKMGKEFVVGTVVVNGSRKEFTNLQDTDTLFGYSDVRVIACGDPTKMKYTSPTTKIKR